MSKIKQSPEPWNFYKWKHSILNSKEVKSYDSVTEVIHDIHITFLQNVLCALSLIVLKGSYGSEANSYTLFWIKDYKVQMSEPHKLQRLHLVHISTRNAWMLTQPFWSSQSHPLSNLKNPQALGTFSPPLEGSKIPTQSSFQRLPESCCLPTSDSTSLYKIPTRPLSLHVPDDVSTQPNLPHILTL